MQPLTFIVPFEVPEDQKEEMRQQWHAAAEPLSHAPGFLSARLYEIDTELETYLREHIPGLFWLRDRFRFVNIARWASLAHYEAATHTLLAGRKISFPSYPAYYRLAGVSDQLAVPTPEEEPAIGQEFTFIIPFEVPEGQEEEMHRQFRSVVEGLSQAFGGKRVPGSLGPGLYEIDTEAEEHLNSFLSRQLGEGPDARTKFPFINVAQWASPSHYVTVMNARIQVKPITFPGHGAYYRVVGAYKNKRQGAQEERGEI